MFFSLFCFVFCYYLFIENLYHIFAGFFGLGLFVFRLFVIFSSLSSLWTIVQCEAMVFTVYNLIILNLGKKNGFKTF